MVEKVLFDLGNVLLRFDFDRAYNALAEHGADITALRSDAMSQVRDDYETGLISTEALYQRTAELSGYEGPQRHFEQSWQDIFEVNTPMVTFLEDLLSQGVPRYLLSNTNDLHVSHIEANYEVLNHFDDIIYSHLAKAMKPDERIFEQAITKFQLDPAKTVYIDDRADNIEAGARLGFQCVHYDPDAHEASETELRALGLIPA